MAPETNAGGDPSQNLQNFTLIELQGFTKEKVYAATASKDFHLFYVGRDDVHDILKYILSKVSTSLYLNMFGYDDDELNQIIMQKALDPNVTMLITLDQSQAGGQHEKALLALDQTHNLAAFNTHFVIGQSATHQISHTKGFVADGKVGAEGSTNWSSSGEGTFVVMGQPGGTGYKAQNNTQSVFTDPDSIARFQAELIAEHMTAQGVSQINKVPQSAGKQDYTRVAQHLAQQAAGIQGNGQSTPKTTTRSKAARPSTKSSGRRTAKVS